MENLFKEKVIGLVPENLQQKDSIMDLLELYMEDVEEAQRLSTRSVELLDFDVNDTHKDVVLDTFMNKIYNAFVDASKSENIRARNEILATGYGDVYVPPTSDDILKAFTEEHIVASTTYRQKKGLISDILYVYDLLKTSGLHIVHPSSEYLNIVEDEPFVVSVESSISKELYDEVIKPLTIPMGWAFKFARILQEIIEEEYGLIHNYQTTKVEIQCQNGAITVFTPDSDDTNVKADFLSRGFSVSEYNTNVTVQLNKIQSSYTIGTEVHQDVDHLIFTDGTYIYRDATDLKYHNSDDSTNTTYATDCKLDITYTDAIDLEYTDNSPLAYEMDFYPTSVTDVGYDDMSYIDFDESYGFTVCGNSMSINEEYNNLDTEYEATSGSPCNGYAIAEKVDGSYYTADTYINGVYTEGVPIHNSFKDVPEETLFFMMGGYKVLSDTSDNFPVTSVGFVDEEFDIQTMISGTEYLFTTDGEYLFTTDGEYLFTLA